jgi:hypothetical protein
MGNSVKIYLRNKTSAVEGRAMQLIFP